jgi:hypothetical protein
MAERHPYITTPGYLAKVINQFRRSFPQTVKAETLKKLGFAPKNESYVLNVLRFLEFIDQEGNRTELASRVFSLHDDSAFSQEFANIVMAAYKDLFELHGEDTWRLDRDALISFFRTSDATTEVVGKKQATTFQQLAGFAGYAEVPEPRTGTAKPSAVTTKKRTPKPKPLLATGPVPSPASPSGPEKQIERFGLTVRIEINLPADGDQETYDRIFRSIRENLLSE